MTADTIATLLARLIPDSGLDEFAMRLCRSVIARAMDGHTIDQLTGYLGYRRRVARPGGEKESARRVARALRTNRWGLRDAVEMAQKLAEERRRQAAIDREARRIFYEQVAAAKALVPEHKRGRRGDGRKGGHKKKTYRRRVWVE